MASKYEGKESSAGGKDGSEAAAAAAAATIEVRAIRVDDDGKGSGPRRLEDVLLLEIDYDSDTNLSDAKWRVRYLVDVVAKRYIVELGEQSRVEVCNGTNTFSFSLDAIDMSGVKKKHLINNAGLLTASLLTAEGEDVIDVNLVVQVAKSEQGLMRHILNPLR